MWFVWFAWVCLARLVFLPWALRGFLVVRGWFGLCVVRVLAVLALIALLSMVALLSAFVSLAWFVRVYGL